MAEIFVCNKLTANYNSPFTTNFFKKTAVQPVGAIKLIQQRFGIARYITLLIDWIHKVFGRF